MTPGFGGHYLPGFVGRVLTEWQDDSRLMILRSEFSFFDSRGVEWKARPGLITDGATIPRIVWPLIGGPFEGPYRKATLMHDQYYESQERARSECDSMLWEAMRVEGCGPIRAYAIYSQVRMWGAIPWRSDSEQTAKSTS